MRLITFANTYQIIALQLFCKENQSDVHVIVHAHPIKAKPVKAGDAKLWVYRHHNDHDRQAAEDTTVA